MLNKPHVVWVCQWYPHEGEPYAGDFIQRHARAAALFTPVTTFSCFPHTSNKIETHTTHLLTEHIIYFKAFKTGFRIIDKLIQWSKWYRLLKKHLQQNVDEFGKPALLHCHIILNAGSLGLWAKKKYGIPYVVTEHWSGYMAGAAHGFAAYNRWSKRLFTKILNGSEAVTGVSEALIQVLQSLHPQATYVRLPNVVDESIFNPQANAVKASNVFRVIHISTFSAQKNMEDTFTAFDALAADNSSIEFHIVGPTAKIAKLWPNKKFSPSYTFHAEMPQASLAELMQSCDVCVLYSHYETFGCVIIEANAVGLPVVVSDIPVLREIVQPNQNGVLVSPSNSPALHQTLMALVNNGYHFHSTEIAKKTVAKFSYQEVGKQIFTIYEAVITGKIPGIKKGFPHRVFKT